MIENLECFHQNQGNFPEIAIHSMCYTIDVIICALIEKLLRIIFVISRKNKGLDSAKASEKSIGNLLELTQKDFLGDIHTHNLQRFLHKFNKAGLNLRNNLAHCNDINKDMLTAEFTYFLFWLFTDVLNTVFLYFRQDFIDNFSHNGHRYCLT